MEAVPDEVLALVFNRISSSADRNSLALSCKRCCNVERLQRRSLSVGCGLNPVDDALVQLCRRFPNLVTLEISYLGWMSNQGRQLDDQGLALLSENCPFLTNLKLRYCCFVTDVGLGNLRRSTNLHTVTLNFIPRISGIGLLSLVTCCGGIRELELDRCMHVHRMEWLEHLGAQGNLESLLIRNCRGVGELYLQLLGCGWSVLRKLVFEVDGSNYRFLKELGNAGVCGIDVRSGSLRLLSLTNCVVSPRRGLSSVLASCGTNLVELELSMCLGLRDEQLISVAENCSQLKSLSLRFSPLFDGTTWITNTSFEAVATYCVFLEKACIGFGNEHSPFVSVQGLALLVQGCCFLRELVLENVACLNDQGLEALRSSTSLKRLELVTCNQVKDEGVSGLLSSNIRELRLCRCQGITGAGFSSFAGDSPVLDVLDVENCPGVTKDSLEGLARMVRCKCD